MNREDFPMLKNNIIYFDNAATTFKPNCVLAAMNDYYSNYTANAHRGDYDNSLKVDKIVAETREKVKAFINARSTDEIIFTSGATDSLNMVINGFFGHYLNEGDEILTTKSEHASLLLPLFELAKQKKLVIKYIDLVNNTINMNAIKSAVSDKTKLIALAHITNTLGDIRDIEEISKFAHSNNMLVLVDGAQSVPHLKIDVQKLDIDFLAFSGHKMLGPTGIGILYGKRELLDKLYPVKVGGGMNNNFSSECSWVYYDLPRRLEAGTPNISGIIGLGAAIDYINQLGINHIHAHELNLKEYAIQKLSKLSNVEIYNSDTNTGIILFNVKGVFSQDVAVYLSKHNVCVRAGNHCAKILSEVISVTNTCRISFYLYNTKEEIDKLVDLLSVDNIIELSL